MNVSHLQVNNTLYISGQIGFNPTTMEIVSGGVVAEAKQALTNMGHILEAANCNFNNVVKTTVLLADINDFAAVNEVYTKFFTENFPARAAYQVRKKYVYCKAQAKLQLQLARVEPYCQAQPKPASQSLAKLG